VPYIARSVFAAVMASGCSIEVPSLFDDDDTDAGVEPIEDPDPPPEWFGLMISPTHGAVVDGITSNLSLRFGGIYHRPASDISIQALSDPADLASWTTLATATSTDTAEAQAYAWQVEVAPGAEERWPQGGAMRVRAIDPDGYPLLVLPHDGDSCVAANANLSWRERADLCATPVKSGAVLLSPSPSLVDAETRPPFLDRKGAIDPAETLEYYAEIDAPATLADFEARFGFGGPEEVSAVYFNRGDLGIGREMRCAPVAPGGLACLVANYGEFGGDEGTAITETVLGAESGEHTGSFATVAMVYQPPITAPNSVQFMVYGPDGGALVSEAPLDTREDNVSIPNNCLNCHGNGGSYDPAGNRVLGARFLPFDPASFGFSLEAGFRQPEQEDAIRLLNQMVRGAGASLGIRELVDGFYGGEVGSVGRVAETDFVPAGWDLDRGSRATYLNAVAPYCRGCHVSRDLGDAIDFTDATTFRGLGAVIAQRVCGITPGVRDMPNAESTLARFWAGPARAYLIDDLAITGSCAPE
jgi:hypothetical protein